MNPVPPNTVSWPVGLIDRLAWPWAVLTVKYSQWVGQAACGSVAAEPLPVGELTDPLR